MLPDIPMSDNFREPLYDFLKKYALTIDQHAELMAYCRLIGISYMCTPFSYAAASELARTGDIGVFKIGSGELTDIPSLVKIAGLGKPMILSTGMCTIEEIDETVAALRAVGATFALMNCVSEYPPVYEDINLRVVQTLMDRYQELTIGHSDHTPDLYTCYAAVALGARIIEKHIILDKLQPGPDQSVSIDMHDLHALVEVGDGLDAHEQAEAVEQLRAQLALLRVHGADQHEPRRVGDRDTFALHCVDSRRRHVEQCVHDAVAGQVDVVEVQHVAVGRGQDPGPEAGDPVAQRGLDVDTAHDAFQRRADGQFDDPPHLESGSCESVSSRFPKVTSALRSGPVTGAIERRPASGGVP